MSERSTPSEVRTEAAKPDGERESFQRKLPYSKVVATAAETEHSIPSVSNRLFNITCAFSELEHLKNQHHRLDNLTQ